MTVRHDSQAAPVISQIGQSGKNVVNGLDFKSRHILQKSKEDLPGFLGLHGADSIYQHSARRAHKAGGMAQKQLLFFGMALKIAV